VTPASVSYYTDEVAGGLEDYYAGRGEAPGRWLGRGSASAGLAGEVSAGGLARLFAAEHPGTGEPLGALYRVRAGADRVTGWDLTFSAPKSVSVLWAVGGGHIGMDVREAHEAAVAAGVAYLDEHAAFSRQGKAGVRQVDTDGLIATGFVHRSSRAGDPQLHTHVLVSGRVRCGDGVWRSLDSRALHRELKTAGMLYQAALRAELTARLGVNWGPVDRNGQADILGVPAGLTTHWSKRRAAVQARAAERIAAAEAEQGRSLTPHERRRAHEVAALETRTAKSHEETSGAGLHDHWAAEAAALGYPAVSWLADTVDRDTARAAPSLEVVVADTLAELQESASTWGRTDVIRHAARRAPTSLDGADDVARWVEHVADLMLADSAVVRLAAPVTTPPVDLRRRDGRSVFEPHGAPRFATAVTLDQEQRVVDLVTAGREVGRSVAAPVAVEAAVAAGSLDEDQAAAVRRVTLDGDAVSCVIGPAGTGKSRTMGAAANAWTASGIPVRGLAVSAAAAGVLQAEAGIGSETIAKFLFEHDRPGGPSSSWSLRPGEVVVVDEAGMVTSADLARIVTLAHQSQAKVVLVGDHAQLGAVGAGGLFRLLARDDAAELTGVHRFTAPWERDASLRLRDHDPHVVEEYDAHGRILGGDRQAMIDDAFHRWHDARAAGRSVVVCAADHATVDALSARARAARVATGEVEPGGVAAGAHLVGVGDEIVTLRNDRRLVTTRDGWVRNGDRWQVLARGEDGTLTVEDLTGRGRTTLPGPYVTDHVTLGYAVTIHKAQGVTVDEAVLLVDDRTTAEGLYVGMTRGRHSNVALPVCEDLDAEHRPAGDPPTPTQVVAAAMSRTAAERAALDVLRDTRAASESLATLAPRLANLDAWIRRETPPDRSRELGWAADDLDRARRHCRPGRLTRAGRDDRRRLDTAVVHHAGLETEQQQRVDWLHDHADTLIYRDELAASVARRRHHLGVTAAATRPAHVVELIGPPPPTTETKAHRQWARLAGQVEAYREEWGVQPHQLRQRPAEPVQQRSWDITVQTAELLAHAPSHSRTAERSISMGIEL